MLAFFVATFLVASIFTACANSTGLLNKHQLRTPLECPCPALAPLAIYKLPSANSFLLGIAAGPDGNMWLTEGDADKIARVSMSGTITELLVPTAGAIPNKIAAGPDGNLWFTEAGFNTIGRITTAGAITEFPLPPPLATAPPELEVISTGPDGNMWFTHNGANVIGVMSVGGALLHTYPVPTANSVVTFIIRGPDGNMWFAEETGNKIGRITMSGVITEFPVPTANSAPKNLVIAADGNLWFPEMNGANIARITTSGVITEFPVPANTSTDLLRRITTTPDGSLWYVRAELAPPWDSEVGKMNLSGVVTDLWSFPNGRPAGLAVGPDNNPWFTDNGSDSVVRL
jgi:streptogramin lyase